MSPVLVFSVMRNRRFILITLLVLTLLLLILFLGATHHSTISVNAALQLHYGLRAVLLVFVGSLVAGLPGSLVGLGGGGRLFSC